MAADPSTVGRSSPTPTAPPCSRGCGAPLMPLSNWPAARGRACGHHVLRAATVLMFAAAFAVATPPAPGPATQTVVIYSGGDISEWLGQLTGLCLPRTVPCSPGTVSARQGAATTARRQATTAPPRAASSRNPPTPSHHLLFLRHQFNPRPHSSMLLPGPNITTSSSNSPVTDGANITADSLSSECSAGPCTSTWTVRGGGAGMLLHGWLRLHGGRHRCRPLGSTTAHGHPPAAASSSLA